jgi:dimethylargininase
MRPIGIDDDASGKAARVALTREVSASLARCELTHLSRELIDLDRARAQHVAYEDTLRSIGCDVRRLRPEPGMPDAVFVEDVAVVVDEMAVVTRPGAASRRGEVRSVAEALAPYRDLFHIEPPGTLDGGDVLVMGRSVLVGLSSRTNEEGATQIAAMLAPFGYTVRRVPVGSCLHLKSAVTRVSASVVLLNPGWLDARALDAFERIEVDPAEPWGANALEIGGAVLYPAAFPRTRDRLLRRGLDVREVGVSELAKAEGGVTCCSVLFRQRA